MDISPADKIEHLPAISPDLVIVRWGQRQWQIRNVSERVCQWLGADSTQISGRTPHAVFPHAVPALENLAADVLEHGQDLVGVKLRLDAQLPELQADLQFAGLTEDYLGQLIRISFRQVSVADRQEVGFGNLVGTSPAMREVFRKIKLYAASDASVIITGETGAGKELVAQALHEASPRRHENFAAMNCAAISEQLLESELFGHERGAFTGAVRDHRGYFERADGGTLFLDELGEMPLHTQAKLLRVLEDGGYSASAVNAVIRSTCVLSGPRMWRWNRRWPRSVSVRISTIVLPYCGSICHHCASGWRISRCLLHVFLIISTNVTPKGSSD